MDYRTWNRLQPGDIVKGPLGRLYEVVKVEAYTRGRPQLMRCYDLLEPLYSTILLQRYNIETLTLVDKSDKSYIAVKVLFGKANG